ncbi:MAG: PadR family transcriptional regulator [Solirubrobacteraceae bacterium]
MFLDIQLIHVCELGMFGIWFASLGVAVGETKRTVGAMSAKQAVLGLVIERPGYGYELAQRLEERCGAWDWDKTGVYAHLRALTKEGHVRERPPTAGSVGRRPRTFFEATPEGEDMFQAWMAAGSRPAHVRQELDLKLLFSRIETLPGWIEQTWTQEQLCLDQLRTLRTTAPAAISEATELSELARVLLRDGEMKALQLRIEWLQNARKAMKLILDRHAASR